MIRYSLLPLILCLASCKSVGEYDAKGMMLNSDKSLWAISDVPQVGSIVRINYTNSKATKVQSSSLFFAGISEKFTPQYSDIGTSEENLSANNGLKFGINFVGGGSPAANVDLGKATSLKLKLGNVRVAQYSDLFTFQNFLRSFDPPAGYPDAGVRTVISQIDTAGRLQRTSGVRTPYWIVTKVFTAENIEYSYNKKGGAKGGANCGSVEKPCSVATSTLTASFDFSRDKQNLYSAAKRPIFVVIKPIGVNSNGLMFIDETAKAPAAISQ